MKHSEASDPIDGVDLPAPGAFFEKLAEKLGATARAAHIFGEAVERDDVTVIPVARARWGLGGGGGKKGLASRSQGMGGGGGVIVEPVGFIELRAGEARYRPIFDSKLRIAAVIAGGFLLMGLVRRLRE
jgi:uncharacterized spore protein YtfJ